MRKRTHIWLMRREPFMLSEKRKKEIETIVDKIISEHQLGRPGFDLVAFLTEEEQFKVGMRKLDKDTTGILLVNEQKSISDTNAHRLIVINSRLGEEPNFYERRRFIAAHEYGHFILHYDGNEIFAHRDYSEKEEPAEEEADYFARCLLMPRRLVKIAIELWGIEDAPIDEKALVLSETFKVTKKKARQRLIEDLT